MLLELLKKVRAFEREAHAILSAHETSKSRVILLDQTHKQLANLSLRQNELFEQGLRCVENGLFRAAHVMAWAAFMDFLEQKFSSDGFNKLRSVRPNWKVTKTEELREQVPEHQLLEAGRDMGLYTRNEARTLIGLLSRRNECAHPSPYTPGLNESLGYISELLQRITVLRPKSL